MITRPLDTGTLNIGARFYATKFINDDGRQNREWVMTQLYNLTFKDEFEYVVERMKQHLNAGDLVDFKHRLGMLEPRSDEVFLQLLEEKRPVGYEPAGGE